MKSHDRAHPDSSSAQQAPLRTPTARSGSLVRPPLGYLMLLLGSFAAASALRRIPALMRIDAAITRHAGPLIVACGVALGVAFPVFMCAVVVTLFNRGKPMTREDLERWERQQMSQQSAGNIIRFNRVYGGSPLAGQRQFLFADVFANWRMGRADPFWRTTYAMMGGGIVLLYGMLAMWFFVGTLQMRVLSAALLVVVTISLRGKARGTPTAVTASAKPIAPR